MDSKSDELKPIVNDAVKPSPGTAEKRKKAPIKKRIKRKKTREEGAPKAPLTGYVRFMNERREKLRIELPDKTAVEHTKIIGEEWNSMSEEAKTPYLQAYFKDKEKYIIDLKEFMNNKTLNNNDNLPAPPTTNNKKLTNGKKLPISKTQINGNGTSASTSSASNSKDTIKENCEKSTNKSQLGDNCIPIFTDEFLEHNKTVEIELRALRKSNTDYELQNSALEKHIETMKFGVEKIENENYELAEKNRLLEIYLDKLKNKLAQALSGLALPSEPQGATVDNIDKYMNDLYGMVTSNSHGPASLNKAKDIIRKLDLHIQL